MSITYEELSAERKELQAKGWLPSWYTTFGWQMFKSKYALEGEEAVLGRFKTISRTLSEYAVSKGMDKHYWEKKFFSVLWEGHLSLSSPALSNIGTSRGLSVSCSGGVVGDSIESFYSSLREQAILSKYGFGCSADFSSIRPRGSPISVGGQASGVVPVIEDFAIMTSKVSQGGNRRGQTASYLNIDHGDFDEQVDKLEAFPSGLNIGWTVTDDFINRLKSGDAEANRRFSRTLYVKMVTGKGYYFKIDEANRHRPVMYKDLGLDVKASNLCTEIMLHSSEEFTFSCILASMNVSQYDKWKNTDAVFVSTVLLDCIVSYFLDQAKDIAGLEKVVEFTRKGRAIGLGQLGFGTLLQKRRLPFESLEAQFLNSEIAQHIHDESLLASQFLASMLGEPEWCKGYGVRNTHRTAIAPTKSTSILMGGISESVFPDPGMVYEQSSAAGGIRRVSPGLYEVMLEKGVYNEDTLTDIINNLGSVQHVSWLTDEEKAVFRTAFEVDQEVILRYASQRQKWLCQGQSLNFFFAEDEEKISDVHTKALLDPNILSLYYVYSRSGVVVNSECVACSA